MGLPRLYLQMSTSKVKTWAEAQAEPTQTYMRLYRETQVEEPTVTQMEAKTVTQSVVRTATQSMEPTEEQTATQEKAQTVTRSASQAEAQTGAQTVTHAWTDANVQVQTEALTEAEVESPRKAQAKRAVKRPREGEAAVSSDAPGTKTGQTRDARKEGRRDGGQQKAQRQDEAGHRRGGKTRSQAKMVDGNNGSAERVSLSDIFSSSGALPFSDELKDPGVFIPERASASGGGGSGRSGEYVIVHGAANEGTRRFDDDLWVYWDKRGQKHIRMSEGCMDEA